MSLDEYKDNRADNADATRLNSDLYKRWAKLKAFGCAAGCINLVGKRTVSAVARRKKQKPSSGRRSSPSLKAMAFFKSTQLDNRFRPRGQREETLSYEPTRYNIEHEAADDYLWNCYGSVYAQHQ